MTAAIAVFALFILLAIIFAGAFDGLTLLTPKPMSTSMLIQGLVLVIVMFSTAFVPGDALPEGIGPVIRHVPLSPILDIALGLMAGDVARGTAIEAGCWLAAMTVPAVTGSTAALSRSSHA